MNPPAFTIPLAPGTIAPLDVISRFGAHEYTLLSLLESRVRLQPDKTFIITLVVLRGPFPAVIVEKHYRRVQNGSGRRKLLHVESG